MEEMGSSNEKVLDVSTNAMSSLLFKVREVVAINRYTRLWVEDLAESFHCGVNLSSGIE